MASNSCFWNIKSIRGATLVLCSEGTTDYTVEELLLGALAPSENLAGTEGSGTLAPGSAVGTVSGFTDDAGNDITFLGCDESYALPAGWENGAPPVEGWTQGYFWNTDGGYSGSTPLAAAQVNVEVYNPDRVIKVGPDYVSATLYTFTFGPEGSASNDTNNIRRYPCGTFGINDPLNCPTEAPTLTEWPSDGTYEIIMSGGKFYAASDDPDAPQYLKDGSTTLNINFGSGQTGTWTANNNGTYTVAEDGGGSFTVRCDGTLV